ncbi:MAG: lipopolysaccharide biosynthesis protein [Bosea sp. (in: a-proteobacteria)]
MMQLPFLRDHTKGYAKDYVTLLGGAGARLAVALIYFLVAANSLSLGDFGRFAACSAAGIILARLAAFGFVSPVFRIATVKPRLTGVFLAGWAGLFVLSLPVIVAAGLLAHQLLLANDVSWAVFAMIIAAEIIGWRLVELMSIANNGLGAYRRGAEVVVVGTAIRTAAALAYWLTGQNTLEIWAATYLLANLLAAIVALVAYRPPQRLRFRPSLYRRWLRDSLGAMAADMIFYLQSELDKIIILALASPRSAGLYAIAMRLIDLTATPIRSFNQIVMQKMMRERSAMSGVFRCGGIELGIAAVSLAGLAAILSLLWLYPAALGRNVGMAAPALAAMWLVPAFRNLTEYHAELLYARERIWLRAGMLAMAASLKAGGLYMLVSASSGGVWLASVNGVFALIWLMTGAITYLALRR